MVMTHTLAKGQGQRSLGLKEWKKTDRGDCITSRADAVGNNKIKNKIQIKVYRSEASSARNTAGWDGMRWYTYIHTYKFT